MSMTKFNVPILLFVLLLVGAIGCANGPPPPTFDIPDNPKTAPQANLEALFDQISVQLDATKPGTNEAVELSTQKKIVGNELAERGAAAVRTRLSEVGRYDGQLPLTALENERAGLEPIKRFDETVYASIDKELRQETESTQRAIEQREARLASLTDTDAIERIKLLDGLTALAGAESEKQVVYAQQRDEIRRTVTKEAEDAITSEDYEKAQSLLGIVQEIDPTDDKARKQKCEVDGKVILKRFGDALETGRVTRSMNMLTEYSEGECFDEIRVVLADSAGPMAEAFGLLGQEATAAKQLDVAYQRYRDAQTISELLLERKIQLPGLKGFLAQVDKAYDKAYKAGEYGLALGYLNVMTELGPTTPQIRQRVRMTRDEVARRAVRGLTTYPFEDPKDGAAKVGDAVASKVVQHIFRTIPSDVRIVEREQLERILEECKRGGTCGDLDTADFIVQGSILDAKVETTEKSGSETRRVVTGSETVKNPDHVRWTQLRERDREDTPEPPSTLTRDVTEDVTIQVTSVRKVGIISVSYRVVEASSGRVLFTDSMQTKQEFQDEGRQGVQLGNFKQETDFVELPPDIEMLSGNGGLADKISEDIGIKLVDFLQNPEDQYAIEAKRFVDEGDFIGAARKAAYAIILREIKSKDVGSLRDELKLYAMESPQL